MGTRIQLAAAITTISLLASLGLTEPAQAQSGQYKRKKESVPATAATQAPTSAADAKAPAADPGKKESEKLDISELTDKYWAPQDTDFSVVQNRTYTKAKRVGASLLAGPVINDSFNEGIAYGLLLNYYFDERYGIELQYVKSDTDDSDTVKKFRGLSGGGTRPDFNREKDFMGIGFNWVPFYAKMSFLGKKIIYFDMQLTPVIGMTKYEQLSDVRTDEKSSFTYGFNLTQFFFFSNNLAVRADVQNRYYKAEVLNFSTGAVARKGDSADSQNFLLGITYFY